ncbi:MAG TPA: HAD family hydrolase [Anaerolineae bacterium]|jgi:FMN phosphatase YigB (HAD superfamily)|nr:HAD family hydrolase [Anaerolineae bacterium]
MTVLQAILFDLDDTLLGNDMNLFLQNYFPLLSAYARPIIEEERFLPELMHATQAMINNDDRSMTNRDVFWRVFCERNGWQREKVEPFLATFYEEQFGQLKTTTERRPVARELVRWCFERELKVVVATNPLFPRRAIEQRLSWAGIGIDEFPYDLVTAYENMHSAKPHSAYYHEILSAVNVEPNHALMVGDDWANDVVPANRIGLYTYWIPPSSATAPDGDVKPNGQGQLEELFQQLQAGWPAP